VLSWQTTFVGDPLYRPCALSLDQQIARLEADKRPELEWAYLRKVNLLLAHNQKDAAEKLCREKAAALSSATLYEKLGDLLHAGYRDTDAAVAYQKAATAGDDSYRFIRVAIKLAKAYEVRQEHQRALSVYEGLISAYSTHKNAIDFYKKARDLAATVGDTAKSRSYQDKIDKLLAAQHKGASK
jgi:tetratricopeptide (TPR) repeat protein